MPIYEVEADGMSFEVDAPNLASAQGAALRLVASNRSVSKATDESQARGARVDPADRFRQQLANAGSFGTTPQPEDMPEGATGKLALAGGILAAPLLVQAAAAPVATATGLALSTAGAAAGGYAGKALGQGLEYVGAPAGTSKVAGTIGGLAGGLAGPMGGPKAVAAILQKAGGKAGLLARLLSSEAATPEAVALASRKLELEVAKLAEKQAAREATTAYRARMAQNAEERISLLKSRLAGKSPEAVMAPTVAPAATASEVTPVAAAKAEEIAAKIVQWRTENKFSGAQIQSALQNLYGIPPPAGRKMMELAFEAKGIPLASIPLRAERVEVGAQQAGRALGMSKEEVRLQSGPILDEALGEASPVLPKKALASIIDKMKALPMAEREAYVARATSGKSKWQVENIRRTLEHLGLLLPVALVANQQAGE